MTTWARLPRRSAGALGRDARARAVGTLAREFDPANAGGGAPKFPPSMALEFLLRDGAWAADVFTVTEAGTYDPPALEPGDQPIQPNRFEGSAVTPLPGT